MNNLSCLDEKYILIFNYVLDNNMERYSFILPLVKTLITKLSEPLNISKSELPNLIEVLFSGNFYDRFLPYCSTEEWIVFIENKVRHIFVQLCYFI